MKIRLKISDILLFLLMFSLFKIYYIPSGVRQIIKIVAIIIIFGYIIEHLPRKKILNISILYPMCMVVSNIINYFNNCNTGISLCQAILNAMLFYDLYSLLYYYAIREKTCECLKSIYRITLCGCIVNEISIFIIGSGLEGERIYFLGNKFDSGYMLIVLIALYGATHNMRMKKNRIKIYILILISLLTTLYMHSITAFIGIIVVWIMIVFIKQFKAVALKPVTVVGSMLASSIIVFLFDMILKIDVINSLVFNTFNKSTSIFGRQVIYGVYLKEILGKSIFVGRGYNNNVIYMISNGVFGNSQNGLIEQYIAYGAIGVIAIIITIWLCFRTLKEQSISTYYLSLIVYAMIIAAFVEISIDWVFFLGICLVKMSTIDDEIKNN